MCGKVFLKKLKGKFGSVLSTMQEIELLNKQKKCWLSVVKRLNFVIVFLSARNLAFCGTNKHFGSQSNGNFLWLIELIAKYDSVLSELWIMINTGKMYNRYLCKDIQNVLISLISKMILSRNLSNLKCVKYSIILDCTLDISHFETMSAVLRYVHCKLCEGVKFSESFFGFLTAFDVTGNGLFETILNDVVKSFDIDFSILINQS